MLLALVVAGCSADIYVRDGVTDGDTFFLAPHVFVDDDPALQSWVSYSLTRSACQLEVGGGNPARVSDFGCELTARQHLVDTWEEQKAEHPDAADPYLDALVRVRDAGFLREYTVDFFARGDWQVPAEVDTTSFREWRRRHLPRHRPETRWTGSWGYLHSTRQ